jgi:hypothetical protein
MFPPDKNELNSFTRFIFEREEYTLVKARNGRIFEVIGIEPDEDEGDGSPTFEAKDWARWWYADGSSCKSEDYDLVEIVGLKYAIRSYLKSQCD